MFKPSVQITGEFEPFNSPFYQPTNSKKHSPWEASSPSASIQKAAF